MPVDWSRYPPNWKEIRAKILDRAKHACEWCGAKNYEPHPVTGSKVVLTTAHLGTAFPDGTPGDKHDKMDVREENLAALCQRCHLRYDIAEHLQNRRRSEMETRTADGQTDLWK